MLGGVSGGVAAIQGGGRPGSQQAVLPHASSTPTTLAAVMGAQGTVRRRAQARPYQGRSGARRYGPPRHAARARASAGGGDSALTRMLARSKSAWAAASTASGGGSKVEEGEGDGVHQAASAEPATPATPDSGVVTVSHRPIRCPGTHAWAPYAESECTPRNLSATSSVVTMFQEMGLYVTQRTAGGKDRLVDGRFRKLTHLRLDGGCIWLMAGIPDDPPATDTSKRARGLRVQIRRQRKKRMMKFFDAVVADARRGIFHALSEQMSPLLAPVAMDLDIELAAGEPLLTDREVFDIGLCLRRALRRLFPSVVEADEAAYLRVQAAYEAAEAAVTRAKAPGSGVSESRLTRLRKAAKAARKARVTTVHHMVNWVVLTRSPNKAKAGGATKVSVHAHMGNAVLDPNELRLLEAVFKEEMFAHFNREDAPHPRATQTWLDALDTNGLRMLFSDKCVPCADCVSMAESMGCALPNTKPSSLKKGAGRRRGTRPAGHRTASGHYIPANLSICQKPGCRNSKLPAHRVNGLFAVLHPLDDEWKWSRVAVYQKNPAIALLRTTLRTEAVERPDPRLNPYPYGHPQTALTVPAHLMTTCGPKSVLWLQKLSDMSASLDQRARAIVDGDMLLKRTAARVNTIVYALTAALSNPLQLAANKVTELSEKGAQMPDGGECRVVVKTTPGLFDQEEVPPGTLRFKVLQALVSRFRHRLPNTRTRPGRMYAACAVDTAMFFPKASLYAMCVTGPNSDYCANRGMPHSSHTAIYFVVTPTRILQHCETRGRRERKLFGRAAGESNTADMGGAHAPTYCRPCQEAARMLVPVSGAVDNGLEIRERLALFPQVVNKAMAADVHKYGTVHNAQCIRHLQQSLLHTSRSVGQGGGSGAGGRPPHTSLRRSPSEGGSSTASNRSSTLGQAMAALFQGKSLREAHSQGFHQVDAGDDMAATAADSRSSVFSSRSLPTLRRSASRSSSISAGSRGSRGSGRVTSARSVGGGGHKRTRAPGAKRRKGGQGGRAVGGPGHKRPRTATATAAADGGEDGADEGILHRELVRVGAVQGRGVAAGTPVARRAGAGVHAGADTADMAAAALHML